MQYELRKKGEKKREREEEGGRIQLEGGEAQTGQGYSLI